MAVDATTLEANAAMKSIVRKDTGEDWMEYLRLLRAEKSIQDPTDEDISFPRGARERDRSEPEA